MRLNRAFSCFNCLAFTHKVWLFVVFTLVGNFSNLHGNTTTFNHKYPNENKAPQILGKPLRNLVSPHFNPVDPQDIHKSVAQGKHDLELAEQGKKLNDEVLERYNKELDDEQNKNDRKRKALDAKYTDKDDSTYRKELEEITNKDREIAQARETVKKEQQENNLLGGQIEKQRGILDRNEKAQRDLMNLEEKQRQASSEGKTEHANDLKNAADTLKQSWSKENEARNGSHDDADYKTQITDQVSKAASDTANLGKPWTPGESFPVDSATAGKPTTTDPAPPSSPSTSPATDVFRPITDAELARKPGESNAEYKSRLTELAAGNEGLDINKVQAILNNPELTKPELPHNNWQHNASGNGQFQNREGTFDHPNPQAYQKAIESYRKNPNQANYNELMNQVRDLRQLGSDGTTWNTWRGGGQLADGSFQHMFGNGSNTNSVWSSRTGSNNSPSLALYDPKVHSGFQNPQSGFNNFYSPTGQTFQAGKYVGQSANSLTGSYAHPVSGRTTTVLTPTGQKVVRTGASVVAAATPVGWFGGLSSWWSTLFK